MSVTQLYRLIRHCNSVGVTQPYQFTRQRSLTGVARTERLVILRDIVWYTLELGADTALLRTTF